jgi:hypothetical protein
MNEMIDRVADALTDEILGNWDVGELGRQAALDLARIALKAMRDPTDDMMEAGMGVGSFPMCNGEVLVRWEAMIDRSLQDQ